MNVKKIACILVSVAIVLSTFVATIVSAANTENGDVNILADSGYGKVAVDIEVPDAASIVGAGSIFSLSTIGTVVSDQKHTGIKSLKLTAGNWAVFLTNGTYCNTNTYVFSAWIKTVGATGTIELIAANNANGANLVTPVSIANGSNEWTKYSISFTVPSAIISDASSLVKFGLQGVGGGSVYVDGFELSQPASINQGSSIPDEGNNASNILKQRGIDTTMETSAQDNFIFNANDSGYTNDVSYSGLRSMKLSGNNFLMTFLPANLGGTNTVFGKTYQFSAWIKTVGNAGTIKLLASNTSDNVNIGFLDVTSTSSDWTKYSFKFTMPAESAAFTASSIVKIGLEALANTGNIYVDSINLVESTPDSTDTSSTTSNTNTSSSTTQPTLPCADAQGNIFYEKGLNYGMEVTGVDKIQGNSLFYTSVGSMSGGTQDIVTDQFYHGSKSLRLTGAGWAVFVAPLDNAIGTSMYGKTFTFTAMVKTENASGTINLIANENSADNTPLVSPIVIPEGTKTWTKYHITFKVPADSAITADKIKFGLEANQNTGKIYIDCVQLYEGAYNAGTSGNPNTSDNVSVTVILSIILLSFAGLFYIYKKNLAK